MSELTRGLPRKGLAGVDGGPNTSAKEGGSGERCSGGRGGTGGRSESN